MKLPLFVSRLLAIIIVIGCYIGFGLMWDNPDRFFWILVFLSFIGLCCTVFYLVTTYTK